MTFSQTTLYKSREWPNFVLGNHDNGRLASRVGEKFAKTLGAMLLTLPGTQTLYYGDEIGMVNVEGTSVDEGGLNRDEARSPMQWDNSTTGGFSNSSEPWNGNYGDTEMINVEDQQNDPNSMLNMYKNLIKMRLENQQIRRGWYCYREAVAGSVVSYTREQADLKTGFLVMINVKEEELDLSGVVADFADKWDIDMGCDNLRYWDSDSVCGVLSGQGFMIFEYDISKKGAERYQNQKDDSECYVSREVRVASGIDYKI